MTTVSLSCQLKLVHFDQFPLMALHLFTWYIPPQNVMLARVTQSAFNPVMLYWSKNFIQGWNMYVNAKHPPILVWNQCAGGLEWVVHAKWLHITHVFYQHELYLQITEINEMTDHHGKHATKSQSSSCQWELSCVNTPLVHLATARWNEVAFFDLGEIYHMTVLVNNHYYHSKQIFLSFHWPRAHHVTCK